MNASDREKFVESRRHYIGGSDIGAVLGVSDYGCALKVWKQKRGVPESNPFFGNKATDRGTRQEPVAAQFYSELTGRQIRKAILRHHKDFPFLRPQADYEIVNSEGLTVDFQSEPLDASWGPGILSIKAPGERMFKTFKYEGLTPDYIVQLQFELACWNRRWGSYGIFWPDGDEMLHWDVSADVEVGQAAVGAGVRFWGLVENGPAPEQLPVTSKPCRRCCYRTECHAAEFMQALGSEKDEGDRPTFDAGLVQIVNEIKEAELLAAEADELLEMKKDKLRESLGGTAVAETLGYRIYYRPQAGRKTFQSDAFKRAHPDLKEEMETKFTSVGKPSRPLRIYEVPKLTGE